jgi:pimeloyl-ACP methyl ester carboxylesterase
MPLIHHVITGNAHPPIVFVHGFACGHTDWDAQVAHLSPRHQTVAVDLRGHGNSSGSAADCSIERYGADVAEVMRALNLPLAVIVGHSLGCRVVTEAALQAPERTRALVLVDGSQFAAAMGPALKVAFAQPNGFATMAQGLFKDMFTAKSNPATAQAVVDRALRLPRPVGEKMLTDLQRYDEHRLTPSLRSLRVPVMAIQTTYSNEKRERVSLRPGQTSPYLDMLKDAVPAVRVAVVADTGHFPQLDEPGQTNALLDDFLAAL